MLSFTENRDQPQNRQVCLTTPFRTSFKTWAQEKTDFANEVSEMALAHTIKNKAEAAYARSDLIEKRKEMMEQWAEYLAR